MAMQIALPKPLARLRIPMPDAVPPFSNRVYKIFWAIWLAAFILAIVGPSMGLYYRYTAPENNSQLLLGSRAGIAVSDSDATRIRFTVGPHAREQGIKPGDDIVAILGLKVPDVLPMTEAAMARNAENPIYLAFDGLFYGTESFEMPLTIRSPDGRQRDVMLKTGEQHIEAGAREMGIAPGLLSFIDLLHVITYPFLLWASWILHRRNARDAVSSILSLAILLTIASEAPSFRALEALGVPHALQVLLFDVGNICLLAGILLFPNGKLSPRLVAALAALPLLLLLRGDAYRAFFLIFMISAVLMLISCLRRTPRGDLRLQIKWALYGFSGYAIFNGVALGGDMFKMLVGSFPAQMAIEMISGLSVGIAFVILQVGLLIALLRYRLYDAEAIISRTASIAIVTLVLGAVFAGVMEGIITQMQNVYENSQTPAAMAGAIMATVLIHPLHQRVQGWIERKFHKNLLDLREGLPELMRDLREVADVPEFLSEVLDRVNKGVYSVRSAVMVDGTINEVVGVSQAETLRWMITFKPSDEEKALQCDPEDPLFPIRVKLGSINQPGPGWLLIGPRPDGSLAGGDERTALIEIADPLTRALRIVVEREKDKAAMMAILESFRARIEQLERRLAV